MLTLGTYALLCDAPDVKMNTMAKKTPETHNWKHLLSYVLTAVFGGIIALSGNYFIQAVQFHHTDVAEDKKQRQTVYIDFLDHTNAYDVTTIDAKDCLTKIKEHTNPDGTFSQFCTDTINRLRTDRSNFQKSINEVYIYGSKDAVAKSRKVAKALPNSLGGAGVGNSGIPPLDQVMKHDPHAVEQPYRDFQAVACKELPALPRDDCDTP